MSHRYNEIFFDHHRSSSILKTAATPIHTQRYTHRDALIHTEMHSYTKRCTHTHRDALIHTEMHSYTQRYTHRQRDTLIHTEIHTQTQTVEQQISLSFSSLHPRRTLFTHRHHHHLYYINSHILSLIFTLQRLYHHLYHINSHILSLIFSLQRLYQYSL
jgi:hypothetical protein